MLVSIDGTEDADSATGLLTEENYVPKHTFLNRQLPCGDLIVTKTLAGNAPIADAEFSFTVTLSDTSITDPYGEMSFENGVATFTLTGGQSKTATGLPADYNTAGIEVDGYLVKASGGVLNLYLGAPGLGSPAFAVKPYVGVGFGRAVHPDRAVSFVFDLGAQYQGKPGLWGTGESITGRLKDVQITADSLGDVSSIVDDYGKYAAFWPTISFHLYVKLF